MSIALTGYPLSLDYRRRLENEVGETPLYLSLPDLRRRSPVELARALGSAGTRCLIPIEHETSYPLLPILETVAGFTRARRIEVVHPDLRREPVSRRRAAASLAALAGASVQGHLALRSCRAELSHLLTTPRADFHPPRSDRIVYANGNLWFGVKAGGSVGHIAGVVNALSASGLSVLYTGPVAPEMVAPEVAFREIEPPRAFALPAEVNNYRFQRSMSDRLTALLRVPAWFVYQRLSPGNYAGVVASRRAGVPLVLEYNGSEVWAAEHWGGRSLRYRATARAAEAACLRHAALVVTVSEVLRDELLERGMPEERIVWHPNCVDPRLFDPARFSEPERLSLRRSLDLPADALVTTFLGTFGEWHGVDVLARTIVELVDRDRELLERASARFLLVGDGVKMPAVRSLLDREPYRRFVAMTGLVPQSAAPLHLAASDILVSPHVRNPDGSRFFGSPTKLFEYMAMGKPVVASALEQIAAVLTPSLDAGSLPERSPTGAEPSLAVLGRPGAADDLGRGLRFLLQQPAWRELLGRNARAEVTSRYTWDRHVDAILAGVERVLGL